MFLCDGLDPRRSAVEGTVANVVRSAQASATNVGDRSEAPTQAERTGAIRAGWNDAAWNRPQRVVPDRLAHWYDSGYAGGLRFRRRTSHESLQRRCFE